MAQLKAAERYLPYLEKLPNQGPQGILLASNRKCGLPLLVEKPAGQDRTSMAQQLMGLCAGRPGLWGQRPFSGGCLCAWHTGEFEAYGPLSAGQLAGKHSLAWGRQLNAGPEGETCAPGEGHVPANCRTSPSFPAGAQNLPPQDMLDLSFPGHLIDQETWLHSPQRAQQSSCSMVHSQTGLLPVVLTQLQHRNQAGVTYLLEKVVYPLHLREGSPT